MSALAEVSKMLRSGRALSAAELLGTLAGHDTDKREAWARDLIDLAKAGHIKAVVFAKDGVRIPAFQLPIPQ